MKRTVIFGATSAIAQAFGRRAAESGEALHLVARDAVKLSAVADDLRVRGARQVTCSAHDLVDLDAHAALLSAAVEALGGLDAVLVAHGILTDQQAAQADAALVAHDVAVNYLSAASLLTHVANRMEAQGHGQVAVITSVAGDRGRASNYVYGASKAALSTFTDGLRHRLHAKGVSVLTVKPGFVDTPMTAHLPKGPLFASAESVGAAIHDAMGRSGTLYVPGFWRAILFIVRHLPEAIFLRTKL
jgi:decaprenylphospho-beta-D-erythro-pentofuranosid-2-ulose 2-reductase